MFEVSSDYPIRGREWKRAQEALVGPSSIFQFHYDLFLLCAAIGICEGKTLEKLEESDDVVVSLPRSTILNNRDRYDFLFQTAILSTDCFDYDDKEKLNVVFCEDREEKQDAMHVLGLFANYGVKQIVKCISDDYPEKTISNLEQYCAGLLSSISIPDVTRALNETDYI